MTPAHLASLPVGQRRLMALAALMLLALPLAIAVVWPAFALFAGHSAWRADAAERLERYQSLTAGKAKIEEQLQQAQSHVLWNGLLPGTDAAAATNALQAEFRGLLDTQKVAVQVSAPVDAQAGLHITRVGVRLNFALTIDQLERLLASVQAHTHRFVLENVLVTAPQYQSPEQNPSLNIQMEVWGFIRAGEVVAARDGGAAGSSPAGEVVL